MDPRFLDLRTQEERASRPYRFTPWGKYFGTYWIGGWVVPRAVVDNMEMRKVTQKVII
jgi:hypothetical protein